MSSLLEVRNLRTQFRSQERIVRAVNGISFSLDRGETLGIVGESGSGKTVSMLSVMRLVPEPGRIVEGSILLAGQDLMRLGEREMRKIRGPKIAMVFQDPMTYLNPVLRISTQMMEGMIEHLGLSEHAARERAEELLETVGIPRVEDRMESYPFEFSGGMRQRVMIAMALSCNPQVLIADEPTTALDVTVQAQIIDLVLRLRDEVGMSIIWITHDLGVIARLADRINVMYGGYIVETGPVEALYADARHPYTLGLLRSVPRVDAAKEEKLIPIEGSPPDMINLPSGCPFYPRCPFRIDRCEQENPFLERIAPDRSIACWVDVRTGKEHTLSPTKGNTTRASGV